MAIADTLVATPPPLRLDDSGTLRVGQTRVTLDVLLAAHASGLTPEKIVLAFDTLDLADVYSAIGYCLRNREAVQSYLEKRERQAEELRRKIEAQPGYQEAKKRFLARRERLMRERGAPPRGC
jgi:uncharacterized protein (DUF433 family)